MFKSLIVEYINILTYSWSWVLLEEPPSLQLLQNFSAFYGTRRFITVFTRALHWSLSWARSKYKSNGLIGNRTRDLPACTSSILRQPTMLSCTAGVEQTHITMVKVIFRPQESNMKCKVAPCAQLIRHYAMTAYRAWIYRSTFSWLRH
jgi:hypothetical protein